MSGLTRGGSSSGPAGPTTPSGVVIRTYVPGVSVLDCVYQTDSGAVDQASAASMLYGPAIGIVTVLDTPTTGSCYVLTDGDATGFAGLIAGEVYMISTNPGELVWEGDTTNSGYPTGHGTTIQAVGVAKSASILLVDLGNPLEQ
jgi:hypothetical protein